MTAGINGMKESVAESIRSYAAQAVMLSHKLHGRPELGFQEHFAAEQLTSMLETDGFRVDREFKGLETAFSARSGSGPFHATIIAEYDALPELGHACGHNVIAATAVLSAFGLRRVARPLGLTVEVLGTPAEEGGGGKIMLAEQGAFEDTSVAMMVHPAPFEDSEPAFFAAAQVRFEFIGRSSHAAAAPAEAINAADAATLAQVAVGLLRQQLPDDVRVHALIQSAGQSVNVIPGVSHVVVEIRARSSDVLAATVARVTACFYGAAQATGCQVNEYPVGHNYPDVLQSPALAVMYRRNAEALGRTFSVDPAAKKFMASTDFGTVSHLVPSLHPHLAICDPPISNHQPSFAAASVSPRADRAIVEGAIAMAWTLMDAAGSPALATGGGE